ncbi:MAG: flavin reductase [Geodermatophilaceae bacterium]|nr:flavin reductase [Geodermatophilaceae bacterium]
MPLGTPDARAFRKTVNRFPTGVTVITTTYAGRLRGLTATAFAGISAEPPLVLVCFDTAGLTLETADRFAVSVLAQHQYDVALRFAERRRRWSAAFDGVPTWPARVTGAPVLSGAIAWFDCAVLTVLDTAGQSMVVGRVHDLGHVDGEPLLQVDGGYRGLDHPVPPPLHPNATGNTLLSIAGL